MAASSDIQQQEHWPPSTTTGFFDSHDFNVINSLSTVISG